MRPPTARGHAAHRPGPDRARELASLAARCFGASLLLGTRRPPLPTCTARPGWPGSVTAHWGSCRQAPQPRHRRCRHAPVRVTSRPRAQPHTGRAGAAPLLPQLVHRLVAERVHARGPTASECATSTCRHLTRSGIPPALTACRVVDRVAHRAGTPRGRPGTRAASSGSSASRCGHLPHHAGRLHPAHCGVQHGAGQVVQRRERGAVGQPGRGLHHRGHAVIAAVGHGRARRAAADRARASSSSRSASVYGGSDGVTAVACRSVSRPRTACARATQYHGGRPPAGRRVSPVPARSAGACTTYTVSPGMTYCSRRRASAAT